MTSSTAGTKENLAYDDCLNPDLDLVDWARILELFQKVNWRNRVAGEVHRAFVQSTVTLFVYHQGKIIAFGRVVGDGRYYAMLADVVVDPDYQGGGLGKYIVNTLNGQLRDYHFVNLTAAPGADRFYKSIGWKKQTTSFIWPQGPKQLRQHCERED